MDSTIFPYDIQFVNFQKPLSLLLEWNSIQLNQLATSKSFYFNFFIAEICIKIVSESWETLTYVKRDIRNKASREAYGKVEPRIF